MRTEEIQVPVSKGKDALIADLAIPGGAQAMVIFSHGSGSSRHSSRNKSVAAFLNSMNIATLLADLLTPEEGQVHSRRFDISLLSQRLVELTHAVAKRPDLHNLKIGYFGASTGAASALVAASQLSGLVKAVVSRGGRPDLALPALPAVKAPVMLIVGSLDQDVLALNGRAYEMLKGHKRLEVISGASHLFEEAGALEQVALLAYHWFDKCLIHPIPIDQP